MPGGRRRAGALVRGSTNYRAIAATIVSQFVTVETFCVWRQGQEHLRPGVRHDTRVRGPSPDGNERLTSSTGLVLLVLLAVETLTTLALRTYLPVHIFLGLLLLPPVALKLASTGWRFARYYTRNEAYRLEGPPRPLLRMLAPLLVAATLSLFGTGVARSPGLDRAARRFGCDFLLGGADLLIRG